MTHKRRMEKNVRADDQKAVGSCPGCGKLAYPSKAAAKTRARLLYPGARRRVYRCETPPHWWHLTSQTADVTAYWKDQMSAPLADSEKG